MKHLVAVVIAVLLLAVVGPEAVLGEDGTPAPGTFPVTPDTAECRVAPRTAEEIDAMTTGVTPMAAAPVATVVKIPLGKAADPETATGVTATAREFFACINAGDFLRVFSLFSADWVRQNEAENPTPEGMIRTILIVTPEAMPVEERESLLAVTDVMELDGGRVGAFVVGPDEFNRPDTIYVTLVQEDDRWLVDAVVDFVVVNGEDQDGD